MSTKKWVGSAKAVAQVNTVTPANVASGNTFTVTCGQKSLTWTAGNGTPATVAGVCAGLKSLIDKARTIDGEWADVTCENLQTLIRLIAVTPGKPFTQTSSASGGTATLSTVTATANSGPHVWGTDENWDTGLAPVDADDVYIETPIDILYDLDKSAIEPTTLNIAASFTARIGLPAVNTDNPGLPYREYRSTFLSLGPVTAVVGYGAGDGSPHIRLNTTTDPVTLTVYQTAREASESGKQPFIWYGNNASNILTVLRGLVGVGPAAGQTTTIATLNIGYTSQIIGDVTVDCGTAVTTTTLRQSGGTLTYRGAVTTVTQTAGTLTLTATGTVTTIEVSGSGKTYIQSTQTITTLRVYVGANVYFSADPRSRTVTTAYLVPDYSAGAANPKYGTIHDPTQTVTFTNGIDRTTTGTPSSLPLSI